MNRRNFLKNILVAGAAFNVLPGAGRLWVAERKPVLRVTTGMVIGGKVDSQRMFVECFFSMEPVTPNLGNEERWENMGDIIVKHYAIGVDGLPAELPTAEIEWAEV